MSSLQDLHELYALSKLLLAGLIFGAIFVVFGAGMIFTWYEVFRARCWPHVAGVIVMSEVDVTTMEMGPGSEPHVSRYR